MLYTIWHVLIAICKFGERFPSYMAESHLVSSDKCCKSDIDVNTLFHRKQFWVTCIYPLVFLICMKCCYRFGTCTLQHFSLAVKSLVKFNAAVLYLIVYWILKPIFRMLRCKFSFSPVLISQDLCSQRLSVRGPWNFDPFQKILRL